MTEDKEVPLDQAVDKILSEAFERATATDLENLLVILQKWHNKCVDKLDDEDSAEWKKGLHAGDSDE